MSLNQEPNYRTDISFTLIVSKAIYILRTSQSSILASEISSELYTCISNVCWTSPRKCQKSTDTQQGQIPNTFTLVVAYSYAFKQSINQSVTQSFIQCLFSLHYVLGIVLEVGGTLENKTFKNVFHKVITFYWGYTN